MKVKTNVKAGRTGQADGADNKGKGQDPIQG